jgi:hypothetical protein
MSSLNVVSSHREYAKSNALTEIRNIIVEEKVSLVKVGAAQKEAAGPAHQLAAAVFQPGGAGRAKTTVMLRLQRTGLGHRLLRLYRLRVRGRHSLHKKRLAHAASFQLPFQLRPHRMRYGYLQEDHKEK